MKFSKIYSHPRKWEERLATEGLEIQPTLSITEGEGGNTGGWGCCKICVQHLQQYMRLSLISSTVTCNGNLSGPRPAVGKGGHCPPQEIEI